MLESVKYAIIEVKKAENIEQLSNCRKLESYQNVYRKKIGYLRAFFILDLKVEGDTVVFEYLVPRGQAYDKKIKEALRKKDN